MTKSDETSRPALRILVVEDEVLIALMLEDYLSELGHEVIGPAMRLRPGLVIAEGEELDLAILDVNLAGETSMPIAAALMRRRIPFMFATAYGRQGLTDEFKERVVLQKPFTLQELSEAIEEAA